ncbi:MAG: hypothetical protein ABS70_04020 [Nitrospira sp. SCN 59-13]|nr:MAG: hypothetical protein ABS70_04020 [Nitrospira sp. SCN 59-13]
MFLPARVFTSKNRRTSLPSIPRRSAGQSLDEQIRAVQSAWADVLTLPLCLGALAFYEWWRWLFSIPSNPLLLTIVAALAIHAARRRRKAYKAELKQLQLNRPPQPTVNDVTELVCMSGRRILHDLTAKCSPATIIASARWFASPANWLAKRLFARS